MPYEIAKLGDKFRIVKRGTKNVAKRKSGKAVDAGGASNRQSLMPQLQAMNLYYARKEGKKGLPPKPK